MNLFLAVVWLLLAVTVACYEAAYGPLQMRVRLGGLNLSLAWIMLVLGIYNVARCYSVRMVRNEQRAMYDALRQRTYPQRPTHPEPPAEPDPNFRFTDEPAPPAPPARHDQPPSNN